ncbi:hypothetical protein B5V46_04280 [Rhodovulum sp. MB263]|nr:hypothetical protein B5V46_04280 [Rhodovulum sp. MB263]
MLRLFGNRSMQHDTVAAVADVEADLPGRGSGFFFCDSKALNTPVANSWHCGFWIRRYRNARGFLIVQTEDAGDIWVRSYNRDHYGWSPYICINRSLTDAQARDDGSPEPGLVSGAVLGAWRDAVCLGHGQRWTDVKAVRAAGVTYQNSSKRPILVSIGVGGGAAAGFIYVSADNRSFVRISAIAASGAPSCASFIVPPGHYYQISNWSGTIWSELV